MNDIIIMSVRRIKTNLFRKFNIKNDKYNKSNTYRNKRVKFNFKRML